MNECKDAGTYLCFISHDSTNLTSNRSVSTPFPPVRCVVVALLVRRGGCSFERKARAAMRLPNVEYVVVYDNDPSHVHLDTMSATDGKGIHLRLLFVSYESGRSLKLMIDDISKDSTETHREDLVIKMNSETNDDMELDPMDEWMLAFLSVFFSFMAVIGFMLVCVQAGFTQGGDVGHRRLVMLARLGPSLRSELLTEPEVLRLPIYEYKTQSSTDGTDAEQGCQQTSCAICLEEFEEGEKLRQLPCQHYFHTDCIVPWLTERQPCCPLCKQDVTEAVREDPELANSLSLFSESTLSLEAMRQRWFRSNPLLRPGQSPEDATSDYNGGEDPSNGAIELSSTAISDVEEFIDEPQSGGTGTNRSDTNATGNDVLTDGETTGGGISQTEAATATATATPPTTLQT